MKGKIISSFTIFSYGLYLYETEGANEYVIVDSYGAVSLRGTTLLSAMYQFKENVKSILQSKIDDL